MATVRLKRTRRTLIVEAGGANDAAKTKQALESLTADLFGGQAPSTVVVKVAAPQKEDRWAWCRRLLRPGVVGVAVGIGVTLAVQSIFPKPSPHSSAASQSLKLASFVTNLETELAATDRARAANKEPLFNVTGADVEVSFVVRQSTTQSGQGSFQFVTVTDETDLEHERVQKLVLKLATPPSKGFSAPQDTPLGHAGGEPAFQTPPPKADRQWTPKRR